MYLGNLDAQRDWGHAKDYVEAMWLILQQEKAEDWVIATGKTTTVRRFVEMSFAELGIALSFEGEHVNEIGRIAACSGEYKLPVGQIVVQVDAKYYRPTEVDLLIGDPTKAKEQLGWVAKTSLPELVKEMMQADLQLMKKEKLLSEHGHQIFNSFE